MSVAHKWRSKFRKLLGALETGSQKWQVALPLHYLTKEIKDIYDSDLAYHLAEMNIPFEKDLNLVNDHFSLK